MTPFDLINTERYVDSPFSVPCPYCGSVCTYEKDKIQLRQKHSSYVCIEVAGSGDYEQDLGTIIGECACNNRECQERIIFVGPYQTERDETISPIGYTRKFVLKFFYPAVPLIRIPEGTPKPAKLLLERSFIPAFTDQSASGNLLRTAIEALLTAEGVPRYKTAKSKRHRYTLHERITLLPRALQSYKDNLLAIKWIGNAASHEDLTVKSLRLAFEIVHDLLEELYGTRRREMLREIKRINRRKKP